MVGLASWWANVGFEVRMLGINMVITVGMGSGGWSGESTSGCEEGKGSKGTPALLEVLGSGILGAWRTARMRALLGLARTLFVWRPSFGVLGCGCFSSRVWDATWGHLDAKCLLGSFVVFCWASRILGSRKHRGGRGLGA